MDTTSVHCKRIALSFYERHSVIDWDERRLNYFASAHGGCVINLWNVDKCKKYEVNRDFLEVMLTDALTILKNPKLEIDNLSICSIGNATSSEFLELRKSLNFPLNVRSIDIRRRSAIVVEILPCLKSGILEEIDFDARDLTVEQFDEVAEMEQWKKAKKLRWFGIPEGIQMEKLHHFKDIKIGVYYMSDVYFIMVRDILLKSAHLELCRLKFGWRRSEGDMMVEKIEGIMRQSSAYDAETRRFSIPNSHDHFQMELEVSFFDRHVLLSFTRVL